MSIGAPQYRDSNVETLAAGKTLVANDAYLQALDPGGAGRTIVLPALKKGLQVIIDNRADAGEDLTVNDAASATVVTISQNEDAILTCDGALWSHVLSKGTT